MPLRKNLGTCGYCGKPGGTTEHVFAKSLLIPDSHAMTIPACRSCNQAKAASDLYLRDFLGLRFEVHDVPGLRFLREAAQNSALKPDRGRPAKAILSTWKDVYGPTWRGEWGLVAGSVTVEGDRVRMAFEWILRGIWFNHQNCPLQLDEFALEGFEGTDNLKARQFRWPDFNEETALGVGKSVRYRITIFETIPPSGTCLIWMYGHLFFRVRFNESILKEAVVSASAGDGDLPRA